MARKGKGKPAGPKLDGVKEANAKPEASDQVKKDDAKLKEENPSVVSGPEDKMEEDKKEKANTETNNANNTPKKKKRLRKKKKAAPSGEASAAKASDKPATSASAEKGSKKADSMGLIFMCNSKTKKDCYQYKVLGLPASKKDQVAKVYKGMRLFLFDVDLRLMYGVYKAAAPGGFNIEPKAFKSAFPSQVRFDVLDDCLPLPEEKFKVAIKENYYGKNKFNCQLTSQQVKDLCKLFRTSSEGKVKPKQGGKQGPSKSVSRGFADRSGRKRQVRPLLVAGGPLPRPAPPIYEREPIYTRESVYEREPYPAPPPPNYVYERPLDADYYRRDPPRVLGLRDRDPAEYRDPYSYRGTAPYDALHAAPALHPAPALPVYPHPPLYRY